MENKILTDKEIVTTLGLCTEHPSQCVHRYDCPLRNISDCTYLLQKQVLDFIHRLQTENKEYETVFDIYNQRKYRKMFLEEWKKEYQKELDKQGDGVIAGFPDSDYVYKRYFEQKAEIERLTAKYRNLENNYEYDHELYRQYELENQKLKEEIERLTEVKNEYSVGYLDGYGQARMEDYYENAELQKQVDELTDKLGKVLLEIDIDEMLVAKGVEKAVKDTAKEIIEKFLGYMGSQQQFCIVDEEHKTLIDCDKLFDFVGQLAREKGVEIEK